MDLGQMTSTLLFILQKDLQEIQIIASFCQRWI